MSKAFYENAHSEGCTTASINKSILSDLRISFFPKVTTVPCFLLETIVLPISVECRMGQSSNILPGFSHLLFYLPPSLPQGRTWRKRYETRGLGTFQSDFPMRAQGSVHKGVTAGLCISILRFCQMLLLSSSELRHQQKANFLSSFSDLSKSISALSPVL